MQFGPDINNGWRTSVCQRCLEAFVEGLKRPTLRDEFSPSEPCEVCRRPVFNLKRWQVVRVICSSKCGGVIDTERAKKLRNRHNSERVCLHCRKKSKPRPFHTSKLRGRIRTSQVPPGRTPRASFAG